MDNPKPTLRQRVVNRWPMLAYHATVLRRMGTVEVTHRVASWVSVLVIFGVGLALLFNQELFKLADSAAKGFDPRLPVVGWVVVIALAFMRANYAEITRRDLEIAKWKQETLETKVESDTRFMKGVRRDMRTWAHEGVMEAIKKGTEDVFVPLRDDLDPDEVKWTSDVAAWDDKNIAMLKTWWTDEEVGLYTADQVLVGDISDWRTRLLAHVRIRCDRLFEIAKRKGKYADD